LEDRIEVRFGDWTRILVVKGVRERPVAKALARELYEDLSPPHPRLDPIERILRRSPEYREKGQGRPTKKDRRQIGKLKGSRRD
jgi:ribosome-associated heat shock protein Hsp15